MFFSEIERLDLPEKAYAGEGFRVVMNANGEIPFAQLILRHAEGWEWIVKNELVEKTSENSLAFNIPAEAFHAGLLYMQAEGCRNPDFMIAAENEWVKVYAEIFIEDERPPEPEKADKKTSTPPPPLQEPEPPEVTPPDEGTQQIPENKIAPQDTDTKQQPQTQQPTVEVGQSHDPVIYFGIHKHMHQPYYRATDHGHWDGETDSIFASRTGAYSHFIAMAVRQYIDGGLPHAGLSTSWSGSLIEQLDRCGREGFCGGSFSNWKDSLRALSGERTALGNPRVEFTAFGHFHPLMPLIPARDIAGQLQMHRKIIEDVFGADTPDILFPPETAFHPHMIPVLNSVGVKAVIFDSIHHFRACRDYPYAGKEEGMLPPNEADQENYPVRDWLQLNNIWAASQG